MNPSEYKQMMSYLLRPKKKPILKDNFIYDGSKNTVRSEREIKEEEINKDPNMLRRIKYYVETYDNVPLGKDFDKAILKEDENIKKARGQNILERGKKRINTTPQKPFKKINKPIVDLKKIDPLPIDPTPAIPPRDDIQQPLEVERRYRQIVEEGRKQKEMEERSGIGGILLKWRSLN